MTGIGRILLVLGAAYLAYAAIVFFTQRSLLYPGRSLAPQDARVPRGPGFEALRIAMDGARVEAWFLGALPHRPGAPPGPAALWFHGNGELIEDWVPLVEGVRSLGLTVLLVEYPGYGRSTGETTEANITAAAVAAYDTLASRPDVDPKRIVAFGRSLGAGAACALARERPIAALVLHSAFTSVRPFAKHYGVPGFLARDVFDNLAVVQSYPGPILVLHGRRDDVVPYGHGVELARAAPNARLVTYETTHNDFPVERLARDLGEFLREHGILGQAAATNGSGADRGSGARVG